MAVNATDETSGFVENIGPCQTSREGILTTNYFFVADKDVYKRQKYRYTEPYTTYMFEDLYLK